MARSQVTIAKLLWKYDLLFPVTLWVASRILIWTAMFLVEPRLPLPADGYYHPSGWEVLDVWDGIHYREIVTTGYEFVNDGKQHNLAFFPLFPLSIWALMHLGLSFEVAGMLINNVAFLAALYCLHFWLKEHCGMSQARWATAMVSWYPSSIFTGVVYTEGLYLFLSTTALCAFNQKQYTWTAICGSLATATRPTGMALIPAFLIAAWQERRPLTAYIASLLTAIGVLSFSLYCAIYFHDPLAFIAAQRGWRPSLGFDWQGWLNMVMQIPFGNNWHFGWVYGTDGGIIEPWYPLGFCIIVLGAYFLWYFRKQLDSVKLVYELYALGIVLLILGNDPLLDHLLNIFMVVGGSYMVWRFRQKLTPVMVIYAACGMALLLASGGTISLSRLAYGIVPLSVAMGLFLSHHRRLGYLTLGIFGILVVKLAIGYARYVWVG